MLTYYREKEQEKNMPIYEYRCEKCGESFEELEFSAHSDDKKQCPKCGSSDTKRIISSFSSSSSSGDSGFSTGGSSCSPGGGGRFT